MRKEEEKAYDKEERRKETLSLHHLRFTTRNVIFHFLCLPLINK